MTTVALIGLGEVGRVFAEELALLNTNLSAWDTAFLVNDSIASRNADELPVRRCGSAAEAVSDAELVISAVTAAQCVDAARSVVPCLQPGAWYFDLNSSSPGHKRAAWEAIEAAAGRYVEAALMSPIGPRRLESPFLLGGPEAEAFADVAARFGIANVRPVSATVGPPAATKLCRSVIVKGLESLLTESLLAARVHGVEREVLTSLSNILPPADWDAIAGYFISRSVQHGKRRAEEMVEAAATVREAGVEPFMSMAAVERQRWAAQFAGLQADDGVICLVDALLNAMTTAPSTEGTDS